MKTLKHIHMHTYVCVSMCVYLSLYKMVCMCLRSNELQTDFRMFMSGIYTTDATQNMLLIEHNIYRAVERVLTPFCTRWRPDRNAGEIGGI